MAHPPYILGGLASWWGYVRAALQGVDRHDDAELRDMIRGYQTKALVVGKKAATAEIVERQTPVWDARVARLN